MSYHETNVLFLQKLQEKQGINLQARLFMFVKTKRTSKRLLMNTRNDILHYCREYWLQEELQFEKYKANN